MCSLSLMLLVKVDIRNILTVVQVARYNDCTNTPSGSKWLFFDVKKNVVSGRSALT